MTSPNILPPVEVLMGLFRYDDSTGSLLWRYRPASTFDTLAQAEAWNSAYCNTLAGTEDSFGYLRVNIKGFGKFQSHRIIFKMAHGHDPDVIDHIDGNTRNNRVENLRSVSLEDNAKNSATCFNSVTGVRGVRWEPRRNKWRAFISVGGKFKSLGSYVNKSDAVAARKLAEEQYGFHPNHGRPSSRGR